MDFDPTNAGDRACIFHVVAREAAMEKIRAEGLSKAEQLAELYNSKPLWKRLLDIII